MANSRSDPITFTTSLNTIYGEYLRKSFVLKGSEFIIGRVLKAGIRLQSPLISRTHCILTKSNDGWIIKDNKSANGTYINGQRLEPGKPHLLRCGDLVFLGPPSETPQAFCVEVDYKFLEEEAMEFESIEKPQITEEIIIADVHSSNKDMSSIKCSEKEIPLGIAKEIIIADVHSSKKEMSSFKYPQKEEPQVVKETVQSSKLKKEKYPRKSSKVAEEGVAVIIEELKENTKTDYSVSTSPVLRHKRKALLTSQCQSNFSVSKSLPKKTKLTSDFEPDKPVNNDQVNEISSTEDDQVEDSLSLLDIKELVEFYEFSNAKDDNKPSCSHNDPPVEEKAENDCLKSQLAQMEEQLKKFKKEQEQIQEQVKEMNKKNKTLADQLAKKEKLENDLLNCELRAKNEIKKELLEKFGEDLMCIICSELLIKPTVLDCAHTFCEYCIKLWKKTKNECPMCRKKIETVTRVLTLDNFIEKTVQTLTPEQREVREKLIKERQESGNKQKATPKQRKNGRRRRNLNANNARNPNNEDRPRDSVEIIGERNVVFPYPSTITSLPFLINPNFRVSEVVRRSMDAINFYLA